jgi:hypothetical protein
MELCLQKFREQLLQQVKEETQESLMLLQFEQLDHFVRNPILTFQLLELLLPMLSLLHGLKRRERILLLPNKPNSLR